MKPDKNFKMKKELKTLIGGISNRQEKKIFKTLMIDAQLSYENSEKNRSKHKESDKE